MGVLCASFQGASIAQVTIGTDSPPLPGTLLQLKGSGTYSGNANADKGLMLPRVKLEQLDDLAPLVTGASQTDKTAHTGMLVYNINQATCPGVYIWNGSEWVSMQKRSTEIIKTNDAESNTFILPPGATIEFPITKAYTVWHSAEYGDILGNVTLSTNPDDLRVLFLWEDAETLIESVELVKNTTDATKSVIRVKANGDYCGGGNASVAILIGGSTVRWSWHIWVTDYNPNTASATSYGANTATKGSVYKYNDGMFDHVFMDRNLGAKNAIPGDAGTIGMYYQWGRKDPIPTYKDWNKSFYTLREIDGSVISPIGMLQTSGNQPLSKVIRLPDMFYGAGEAAWTSDFTSRLWTPQTEAKSYFDPCPKGWRVPAVEHGTGTSPWDGLYYNSDTDTNLPWSAAGKGRESAAVGYYPAAGEGASSLSAGIEHVGSFWTASSEKWMWGGTSTMAYAFEFQDNSYGQAYVAPLALRNSAFALPVRCEKE
ncbi:hypothetical protein D0T66_09980 [Dysgonomonas sp. 25]|nr:hypothetical protein [Dysgonomonas sp. 25]